MSPLNSLQRARFFLSYLAPGPGAHGFDNKSMRNLHVVQASQGHVLCSFQVAEESLNNHGSLHGGCIATLVDVVGSLAIATVADRAHVSLVIQTHYHAPIPAGCTIAVEAQVVKLGAGVAATTVDFWQLPAMSTNTPISSSGSSSSSGGAVGGNASSSSYGASPTTTAAAGSKRKLLASGTHVKVLQPATFDLLWGLPDESAAAAAGLQVSQQQAETAAAVLQEQRVRLGQMVRSRQLPPLPGVFTAACSSGWTGCSGGTGCVSSCSSTCSSSSGCSHCCSSGTCHCSSSSSSSHNQPAGCERSKVPRACSTCCCQQDNCQHSTSSSCCSQPAGDHQLALPGGHALTRPAAAVQDAEAHHRADLFLHSTFGVGGRFDTAALAGCQLLGAAPGRVWVVLLVGQESSNSYGTLHGGCTATLVDVLGTAALVTTSDSGGVSLALTTHYLRPAPTGSLVLVDAQVVKAGGSIVTMDVDLYCLQQDASNGSTNSSKSSSSQGTAPTGVTSSWQLVAQGTLVKALSSGLAPAGNLSWLWPLRREDVAAALTEQRALQQRRAARSRL